LSTLTVTAILPRGKQSGTPVYANWFSFNGNGEMTGTTFLEEFGQLCGSVTLTNTLSVGAVHSGTVAWQLKNPIFKDYDCSLPVVAETYDGLLNDIAGFHVKETHVFAAFENAKSGMIAEGNVGGGTGMMCHEFKGGTGTASRKIAANYTIGVLVQTNYGGRKTLMIAGVPVGLEIPKEPEKRVGVKKDEPAKNSSIIIVVATDAPLLPHQLKAVARRATIGLGRVGGLGNTSSGDIFLAFSTANADAFKSQNTTAQLTVLTSERALNQIYEATAQATEEAIVNALVAAETMKGYNGNTVYALPHDKLKEVLRKYNRLQEMKK
jgi:L-aminopeptidase/D-esterase-like protein